MFSALRTAAASALPPPIPAPLGICFSMSMHTVPETPAASMKYSAARYAVFRLSVGTSSRSQESDIPFPALTTTVTPSASVILCITVSSRW